MKKLAVGCAITFVLLGLAYLGSIAYVGSQVEAAMQNVQVSLTESSEVVVHRFDYERGFQSGLLHYDLEWSPLPGTAINMFVAELRNLMDDPFRFAGTAQVRHGPWVGGSSGLGLARLDVDVPVIDEVRRALPQYPGDSPAVYITSVLGFDGIIRTEVSTLDYDGSLVIDDLNMNLVVAGLGANLELQEGQAGGSFELGRLSVGDDTGSLTIGEIGLIFNIQGEAPDLNLDFDLAGMEFAAAALPLELGVEDVSLTIDVSRLLPGIWLGDSEYRIASITYEDATNSAALLNSGVTSTMGLNDAGLMIATSTSSIERLSFGDVGIDNLTMGLAYDNLNTEAYSELASLIYQMEAIQDYNSLIDSYVEQFNAILADSPTVSINPISVSVVEEGDTSASVSLSYDGPVPIEEASEQDILNGILLSGDLSISQAAARGMIELFLTSSDDTLSGAALAEAVETNYEQLIAMLRDTEFFTIGADAITSTLQVVDGVVSVNGVEAMNVSELYALVEEGVMDPGIAEPPAVPPVFSSDAIFENVTLEAGFTNTPYTVELVAGGENPALSILGADCFGNVYSEQPDVTLSYTAGAGTGLYVYAESEDDTTLVVLTPAGWLCDDDSHGEFNPGISQDDPQSGDYLIWVGTFDGGTADAVLGISEFR